MRYPPKLTLVFIPLIAECLKLVNSLGLGYREERTQYKGMNYPKPIVLYISAHPLVYP